MKIENEWLDAEILTLNLETKQKKKKKSSDSLMALKLFLMVTAVFFYAPVIEARTLVFKSSHSSTHMQAVDGGRHFICPKCRMCQWQDNKNADWAGNFTCSSCGANLGK